MLLFNAILDETGYFKLKYIIIFMNIYACNVQQLLHNIIYN